MKTTRMNKQKGITLIALVITIIVLLILAGVAISMLSGENGILKQAAYAKIEYRGATVEEARNLWKIEKEMDEKNTKTLEELIEELVIQKNLTESEKDIILGNEEKGIEATGKVTIGSKTIEFYNPLDDIKFEVNLFVAGYNIICIYTDEEDVAYTWKDLVMYDISDSGYQYEGKNYKKVYAYLTKEAVSADDFKLIDSSSDEIIKVTYDYDFNCTGIVDVNDISMIYGVRNGYTAYFEDENLKKYMHKILKCDVDKNKVIDDEDTTLAFNYINDNS